MEKGRKKQQKKKTLLLVSSHRMEEAWGMAQKKSEKAQSVQESMSRLCPLREGKII